MAIFNGGGGRDRMYGHDKTSDWDGRDDDLFGHGDNDTIYGMRGDDRLFGGAGNDVLVGGSGNDDVFGDSGADHMIYERGDDTFSGGSGTDTLEFKAITFITTTFDMVASVLTSGLASGIDYNVRTGVVEAVDGDRLGTLSLSSVEKLTFTGHGDRVVDNDVGRTIETYGGNDRVEAGGGDDTVELGAGNDVIDPGFGIDRMKGGSGTDELSFSSWNTATAPSGQTVGTIIELSSTIPGQSGSASIMGFSNIDNFARTTIDRDFFSSFENVTGSRFADVIKGDANANVLKGEGGRDTIQGGAGADTLFGGSGTDTLSYAASASGVRMSLLFGFGGGGDAQGDAVFEFENLTGSDFADDLQGNHDGNVINGGGGLDTILGRLGNDTIDGGSGRDFITGGGGRDALKGGSGADDFIYRELSDSIGAGTDTIGDFQHGIDRIDLSLIDAISGTPENDSFTFIHQVAVTTAPGTPAIAVTPLAGQLLASARAIDTNDDSVEDSYLYSIAGHVDGGGTTDFQLSVLVPIGGDLSASDFLL